MIRLFVLGIAFILCTAGSVAEAPEAPFPENPFTFPVQVLTGPEVDWDRGYAVLLLGDLTGDGAIELVLVGEQGASAYTHQGEELWVVERPSTYNKRTEPGEGTALRYHATAGVIGNEAFYFIAEDQTTLVVVDGKTGDIRQELNVGPEQWTDVGLAHLFSQDGPEDIVLLRDGYIGGFTGYRNTNKVAAIRHGEDTIIWEHETDHHMGIAFAHMRIADIDGDGYDEIATGRVVINNDGTPLPMRHEDPVWGDNPLASYTTLQVANLFPDRPGLEAFVGQYFIGRYGVHSFTYGMDGFQRDYGHGSNAHSAVIGEFAAQPGWEGPVALIRSNKDVENNPPDIRYLRFLNLSTGEEHMQDHVPETSWSERVGDDGRPVGSYPRFIDWTGSGDPEIMLIERHDRNPRVSVNVARTGELIFETTHRGIGEAMARVFDIAGDGREEVIVWNREEVAIYWNADPVDEPVPPKRTQRDYMLRSRHGSFVDNYPQ